MSVEIFAHFCWRNHVSFQFNTLLSRATTYSMTEGQKDSYPKAAPQVFALPSSLSWVSFGGILNGKNKQTNKQTSAILHFKYPPRKITTHDYNNFHSETSGIEMKGENLVQILPFPLWRAADCLSAFSCASRSRWMRRRSSSKKTKFHTLKRQT